MSFSNECHRKSLKIAKSVFFYLPKEFLKIEFQNSIQRLSFWGRQRALRKCLSKTLNVTLAPWFLILPVLLRLIQALLNIQYWLYWVPICIFNPTKGISIYIMLGSKNFSRIKPMISLFLLKIWRFWFQKLVARSFELMIILNYWHSKLYKPSGRGTSEGHSKYHVLG